MEGFENTTETMTLAPVAVVHSPFKEKFGIPRQPGLITDIPCQLELLPPFNRVEAVRGLQDFSHLWLLFKFHACPPFNGSLTVRPPRLGGNQRIGVFASRSTFRPNPLGMSVVALEKISAENGIILHIKGADLLDRTPVYDIKPYLPYADQIDNAQSGFAHEAPEANLQVAMDEDIQTLLCKLEASRPELTKLAVQVIGYDPRPAFKKSDANKIYSVRLYDLDVRFFVEGDKARIVEVEQLAAEAINQK